MDNEAIKRAIRIAAAYGVDSHRALSLLVEVNGNRSKFEERLQEERSKHAS